MNIDYTQDQLTISNVCPECIAQEQLCVDCVEEADARLTDQAYELVDEGNLQYRRVVSIQADAPSASDWVSSETITGRRKAKAIMKEIWADDCKLVTLEVSFVEKTDEWLVRNEFLEPTVSLADRGELDNTWELDDYAQAQRETQCPSCHLMTPRIYNDCQCCDAPLEMNVR